MNSDQRYPYYDVRPEYYEKITAGMTDKEKQGFGNALAHHMIPITRNKYGWWMTRADRMQEAGQPRRYGEGTYTMWDLLDREGKWLHNQEFKE